MSLGKKRWALLDLPLEEFKVEFQKHVEWLETKAPFGADTPLLNKQALETLLDFSVEDQTGHTLWTFVSVLWPLMFLFVFHQLAVRQRKERFLFEPTDEQLVISTSRKQPTPRRKYIYINNLFMKVRSLMSKLPINQKKLLSYLAIMLSGAIIFTAIGMFSFPKIYFNWNTFIFDMRGYYWSIAGALLFSCLYLFYGLNQKK